MLKVKYYPNPFVESVNIEYTTDEPVEITIIMYDHIGLPVKDLMTNELVEVGKHKVIFDARGLSKGMYIGLIKTKSHFQTIKLLLVDQEVKNI